MLRGSCKWALHSENPSIQKRACRVEKSKVGQPIPEALQGRYGQARLVASNVSKEKVEKEL
jgi:hypothetical protein